MMRSRKSALAAQTIATAILWLLTATASHGASLPGATPPSQNNSETLDAASDLPAVSGYILAGQFPDRDTANAAARQFEHSGFATLINLHRRPDELVTVYFGPFRRAEDAERLRQRLLSQNVDAFVFETTLDHNFVVHAGAFATLAAAEKRLRELKPLELPPPSLGRKRATTTLYQLWVDVSERTQVPRAPAPIAKPMPMSVAPVPVPVPPAPGPRAIEPIAPPVLTTRMTGTQPAEPPQPEPVSELPDPATAKPVLEGYTSGTFDVESRNWRQRNQAAGALALTTTYRAVAATPDGRYTFAAGIRADFWTQAAVRDAAQTSVDYLPSFIGFHETTNTWSLGFQRIDWNRSPTDSALDGLATRDLTRFVLDDELERRRRANAAIQWQHIENSTKLEVAWLPLFRPAELPDAASIWHPINRERGQMRGLEESGTLRTLIQGGTVGDPAPRFNGGIGIRATQIKGSRYQGYTAQHYRRSEPYFVVNPGIQAPIKTGIPAAQALASSTGPTLSAVHPSTWLLGLEEGSDNWHFEVAWSSATPATRDTLAYITVPAATWQTSLRLLPAQSVSHWLTLSGTHLMTQDAVLDRKNTLRIAGNTWVHDIDSDWRWGTQYLIGLDHPELHLNPYIIYMGFNKTEVSLGLHIFGGARSTEFGYHNDHNQIALAWSGHY